MDKETRQLAFLEAQYQQAEMDWIAAHHRVEEALLALAAFINRNDPVEPPDKNSGYPSFGLPSRYSASNPSRIHRR